MTVSQPLYDAQWRSMFRIGAVATIINIAMIPVQIIIYMISQPPVTVPEWFALLQDSPLLGLLNLDLLYVVNNLLLIPIYFALYGALKPGREVLMALALIIGLIGIAAYVPSNTALEMLILSNQYAGAAPADQAMLLGAAQALVVKYQGTAFVVYYILNAIVLLMMAFAMLRSPFSKATAYAGIVSGVLMLVPSNVGTIGLIFAFASLFPWVIFSFLIARRFWQLGHPVRSIESE